MFFLSLMFALVMFVAMSALLLAVVGFGLFWLLARVTTAYDDRFSEVLRETMRNPAGGTTRRTTAPGPGISSWRMPAGAGPGAGGGVMPRVSRVGRSLSNQLPWWGFVDDRLCITRAGRLLGSPVSSRCRPTACRARTSIGS